MLLNTKQSKGESSEHFFGKWKELPENSDFGNQEDNLIRGLFIANMQDPEIQRELLRETLEPAQALRLAINMEIGQRHQLQISNAQSASHVNAITPSTTALSPIESLTKCYSPYSTDESTLLKLWPHLVSKSQGQMYCKIQDMQ